MLLRRRPKEAGTCPTTEEFRRGAHTCLDYIMARDKSPQEVLQGAQTSTPGEKDTYEKLPDKVEVVNRSMQRAADIVVPTFSPHGWKTIKPACL